jgi:FixJ family two-component response regulator
MSEVPLVAVVDDDESVREATQSLLLSAGFRAAVFASAEDFLQAPQRQDTACLIVDVRMPGMSGLDLQQQLARRRSAIALIFITSHEDDEARARALRAGAVDFLYKPFSDEALLRAIRSALRGAAS